jgi:hypothetical protein
MCERKDATAGGVQRKGPGLHYKPFGASGRSITAFFLRNLRTVLAHFFQNLPSIESWVSSDASCAFTSIGSMNNTDPRLGPLANNGGPTLTMALLPGSPAIDAGNTSLAPATDQRGFSRPAGLAADIGAFEYGSVMQVIAVRRSGATGLNILATGNAGRSCRLLSSPDLSSWVPVATNQFGSDGTILFNVN